MMSVFERLKAGLLGRKAERDQSAAKKYEALVADILADKIGDGPKDVVRIEEVLQATGVTLEALEADVSRRRKREAAESEAARLAAIDHQVRETRRRIVELADKEKKRLAQFREHHAELETRLKALQADRTRIHVLVEAAEKEGGPLAAMSAFHAQVRLRKLKDERDLLLRRLTLLKKDALEPAALQLEVAAAELRRHNIPDSPEYRLSEKALDCARNEERSLQSQLAQLERDIQGVAAEEERKAAPTATSSGQLAVAAR